jgi:hypothetical protein
MFQLTGDPYALEEMQFLTSSDYCYFHQKALFGTDGNVRTYAWHMRNVAHVTVSSPASVPSWLKPKSYWQTYLNRALTYSLGAGPNSALGTYQQRFQDFTTFVSADGAGGVGYIGGSVSGFMEEYCMGVFLHMNLLGLSGWDAMANWKILGVIARTNGTSGYNKSVPTAYDRMLTTGGGTAPVCADWAGVWASGVTYRAFYYTPPNSDPAGLHITASNADIGYQEYVNANLNMAARLGIAGVAGSKTWLNAEMVGRMLYQRWAVQ